ncbi:MAG: efflux RND transporter permease subunit, partial [Spirochaetaceae bacterium]|nr:efflux RND transporter permease subunit [Spirochaetaceae bacterium]
MNISELSVRKPVTITMVYVLVCVIAAVFVPRLGVALYPDATRPVVSVMTTYENVGPDEIDKTVTKVIVNQLRRVPDLQEITSTSSNGRSVVRLNFSYKKNIDEAINDINSALTRVLNALPDNCGTPSVMKFDNNARPIMFLALVGDMSLEDLKTEAEDTVQPLLERVGGVASADVWGGADMKIRVDVNNNRLEAYGITLTTVMSALAARNVQVSNGTITQETMDYEIITDEYFKTLDDIRNTIITTAADSTATVRLDDVATVYEYAPKNTRRVYINGEPGIYIAITNESGSNPSSISKAVHRALPEIDANLPRGVKVEVISDDTSLIDSTMNEVYSAGLQGILLTMLVIFLFLRNFKISLIIGFCIPISILVTLMVMSMMELTINLMTMSGLILGMGMTVDSSIVIIENINKRRSWGEKSAVAAVLGSRNMILAIMASSLTTICVFVPILIYRADLEMYGQMFQEVVITVVVSLVASLIVSVTLVPALCGSILHINTRTQKPIKNPVIAALDNLFVRAIGGLEIGYARVLRFCLKNRLLVLALAYSVFVIAMQQFGSMGMNLTPPSNTDEQMNVTITLPTGTNTELVRKYLFDFQDIILKEMPREAYKTIVLNTGTSNSGSIQINLPKLKDQTMNPAEIRQRLVPYVQAWSDVRIVFTAGRGPSRTASSITIDLISDDADGASQVANQIVALIKARVPRLTDADTDMENGSPRYEIFVNTDAAAAAGVSVNTISSILKT